MSEYAPTLGGLLLGAFLNTYFYGIVFVQNVAYHNTNFDDPYWVRVFVVSLFCIDTVHTASLIYMAWVYAVQNYNHPEALQLLIWPLPFTVLIITVVAFLVQTFLAYRILCLTRSRLLYGVTILASMLALVAGLVCSVTVWKFRLGSEAVRGERVITIWQASEVGVDSMITITLIVVLLRLRNNFHRSNTLINRLIRGAIQSGLVTSIFAVLSTALFFKYPVAHFYAIVSFSSAHLYSITIMNTLLVRHRLRQLVSGNMVNTSVIWGLETWGLSTQPTDGSFQLHIRTVTEASSDAYADHPGPDALFSGITMKHLANTSDPETCRIPAGESFQVS